MARPAAGYRTSDGQKVPGVTTLCKMGADSGGLVHAAWKLGMEGKNYREVWGSKRDSGSVVHEMVEAYLHGKDPQAAAVELIHRLPDTSSEERERIDKAAQTGFLAFLSWAESSKLEVVATEESLVSEVFRYGGTLDAVVLVAGELAIGEWKSSRLYPEHSMQVVAYAKLWEEVNPNDKIQSCHLISFDKETAGFTHKSWPIEALEPAWQAFLCARRFYDFYQHVKKMV